MAYFNRDTDADIFLLREELSATPDPEDKRFFWSNNLVDAASSPSLDQRPPHPAKAASRNRTRPRNRSDGMECVSFGSLDVPASGSFEGCDW